MYVHMLSYISHTHNYVRAAISISICIYIYIQVQMISAPVPQPADPRLRDPRIRGRPPPSDAGSENIGPPPVQLNEEDLSGLSGLLRSIGNNSDYNRGGESSEVNPFDELAMGQNNDYNHNNSNNQGYGHGHQSLRNPQQGYNSNVNNTSHTHGGHAGHGGIGGPTSVQDTRNFFLGGLSNGTTPDMIAESFMTVGAVEKVTLKKDQNTGLPRGFGFVTMVNLEDGQRVMNMIKHNPRCFNINGTNIECKPAVARSQLRKN